MKVKESRCLLGKMKVEESINASLVNVQEKKVSEQQMGKQWVHSTFIAKEGNMPVAFIHPELSHSDFELENMANPLQNLSFTPVSLHPIISKQSNGCKLNFLNAVRWGQLGRESWPYFTNKLKFMFLTSLAGIWSGDSRSSSWSLWRRLSSLAIHHRWALYRSETSIPGG
jgi:hypothetical protein